jgi:hypothetical protein
MISVQATVPALAQGRTSYFFASGGTPPYTYKVRSGGAGGAIDPSTGLYTAPELLGIDTINAFDSLGALGSTSILIGDVIQLVGDILRSQMGLGVDQIWEWNQKEQVPNDSRFYISVRAMSDKPFANVTHLGTADAGVTAFQFVRAQTTLQIDFFSRSQSIVPLRFNPLFAMQSIYSQQQQEANAFSLSALPRSFLNLTEKQGAAILYWFSIHANVRYFVPKSGAVPYFSQFNPPLIYTDPAQPKQPLTS